MNLCHIHQETDPRMSTALKQQRPNATKSKLKKNKKHKEDVTIIISRVVSFIW